MSKLTLITVNGVSRFYMLPYDSDGRVRVDRDSLFRAFRIPRGACVSIR